MSKKHEGFLAWMYKCSEWILFDSELQKSKTMKNENMLIVTTILYNIRLVFCLYLFNHPNIARCVHIIRIQNKNWKMQRKKMLISIINNISLYIWYNTKNPKMHSCRLIIPITEKLFRLLLWKKQLR